MPDITGTSGASDKLLLRVGEVAERLSVGRATVYHMISSGDLETVRVGRGQRSLRVPAKSIDQWLDRQQRTAGVA